ncbi:hypothetical protein MASR2M17_18770 [Aminivibrio sp.]
MTETEALNLLAAIRRRIGIVFISHRLDEIINVADRVTVLRDGELVATKNSGYKRRRDSLPDDRPQGSDQRVHSDERTVSDEIFRRVEESAGRHARREGQGWTLRYERRNRQDRRACRSGKLGIAANGIMGTWPARRISSSEGKPMELNDPHAAIAPPGMGFVSEDRKGWGFFSTNP